MTEETKETMLVPEVPVATGYRIVKEGEGEPMKVSIFDCLKARGEPIRPIRTRKKS